MPAVVEHPSGLHEPVLDVQGHLYTVPDHEIRLYVNLAQLCLRFIQLHELKNNIASYKAFKRLLKGLPCLPTDPEARLRSTDLAMEKIKQFVLGFKKPFLLKEIEDLLRDLLVCGIYQGYYDLLEDLLDPEPCDHNFPPQNKREQVNPAWRIIKRIPGARQMVRAFMQKLS